MKNISIIIVSFNTKDLLDSCIRSIKDTAGTLSYEIIVVDNASNDDSIAMLKQKYPDVLVISNKENTGFSKANNQGVAKATGEHILFLNPDTLLRKNTLGVMYDFMQGHEEVGAATCRVVLPDGKLDDASHRGFPTPWNSLAHFSGLASLFPKSKIFAGYSLGWMDKGKIHEVDALAGAFMMVRKKAGDEVGWWDEDFFWYGEDIDFCYRLKEKGWKIFFVPDVEVLHYKGVSGGIKKASKNLSSATLETRVRATIARFDAMRIFYKKHYQSKYPGPLTWLVLTGIRLRKWISLRSLH